MVVLQNPHLDHYCVRNAGKVLVVQQKAATSRMAASPTLTLGFRPGSPRERPTKPCNMINMTSIAIFRVAALATARGVPATLPDTSPLTCATGDAKISISTLLSA